MTTEEFFKNKINEITISLDDDEQKFIESKHNGIREKLRERLNLKDDFLTGSYKRWTQIKPKKVSENFDVDVFLAFNKEDYGEKELEDLRSEVEKAVKDIKNNDNDICIISINTKQRRSIGVEFGKKFQIDLVPAIEIEKDKKYKIFDKRTLGAVISNPKLHGKLLTEANDKSESGGVKRLVPLVRLLKSWKREKCDYLKSFHLELLILKALPKGEINSFSDGLYSFFTNVINYLQELCLKDPANNEVCIDDYLDEDNTRDELQKLVEEAKEFAEEAKNYEEKGAIDSAIKKWKMIFASKEGKILNALTKKKFMGVIKTIFALGNYNHREYPEWPTIDGYEVDISCNLHRKRGSITNIGSNLVIIEAGDDLQFKAKTNAPSFDEVYWQVVNTGDHAMEEGGLRREFFKGRKRRSTEENSNPLINWEFTLYNGSHWIECHVTKDGLRIAHSERFYVNIINKTSPWHGKLKRRR